MSASAVDIGVNLSWCVPSKVGGSEQYLTRQLAGLAMIPEALHKLRVTMYAPQHFSAAHRELSNSFHIVEMPTDGHNRGLRIAYENTGLARHTKTNALVHHGGGTMPFRGNKTTLLTVHDVQYLSYPEYFSPIRLRYLAAMMPRSLRRATAVAVPSAYVRDTLIQKFHLAEDDVFVVRHGVEMVDRSDVDVTTAVRRHGLESVPYFIYPAMTHPHKNHQFLITLLSGPWRHRSEHIVFIGHEGRAHNEVMNAIAASGCAHRVHMLGRVEGAERDALVAGAEALVFPSQYEGFGAPLIEAMSLQVPVVCSNVTSLPGVAGDAALVLPLTTDAWAAMPQQVEMNRASLVLRGVERAREFSLAASGADLFSVYQRVLAR
jgi:glycosyltransferase involved in cell wall biosynthesis